MRHLTFLLLSAILKNGICTESRIPNIAIIGGGIGGSSSSYFLTELFNGNLNIDLYEPNKIGGRLRNIEIDTKEYEAGGSIIHSRNKYMQDFVKLLGMEHRASSDQKYGIWNGKEFVFKESDWEIVTIAKLWYRYGIQPYKLQRYINSILNDFEKIYALQDAGKYFTNVTSLLLAMNNDFPVLLEISIKDQLTNMGFAKELIDELVKATLVVNYGQSINVQSFVGAVSLAGAGGGLWSIKGGNKEVPEHLIYRNKHISLIPSYVSKISYMITNDNSAQYKVHYYNKGSMDVMTNLYDIVIIATPLTNDQEVPIIFENIPNNDLRVPGTYHTTVATFIKGDLNPQYFGLDENLDGIFSCDPNRTIINALGKLDPVDGPDETNSRVWKIFSEKSLNLEVINNIFTQVDEVKEIIWKAYPKYSTNMRHDKFMLHNALYYVNAIEWAASAMEMSAIAGRNVAILAYNNFYQGKPITSDNNINLKLSRDKRFMEL